MWAVSYYELPLLQYTMEKWLFGGQVETVSKPLCAFYDAHVSISQA